MAVESTDFESLHQETWDLINSLKEDKNIHQFPIILLTHIPLYKPAGSCPGDEPSTTIGRRGFITQQNLWEENTTNFILNEIKPLFVFNGHDHSGCIYQHNNIEKTLEVTMRSVMGDYGGYTGYLEISKTKGIEKFEYQYFSTTFVITYLISVLLVTSLIVLIVDIVLFVIFVFFRFVKF
jgi:hypothetical protein